MADILTIDLLHQNSGLKAKNISITIINQIIKKEIIQKVTHIHRIRLRIRIVQNLTLKK